MSETATATTTPPADDGVRYQTVSVGNIPPNAKYMAIPAFLGADEVYVLSVLRRDAEGNWQGVQIAAKPTLAEIEAYIREVVLAHLAKPAAFWDAAGRRIEVAAPAAAG